MNPFNNRKKIDELIETLRRIDDRHGKSSDLLMAISLENQTLLRDMTSRMDAQEAFFIQRITDAHSLNQKLEASFSENAEKVILKLKILEDSVAEIKSKCAESFRTLFGNSETLEERMKFSDTRLEKSKEMIINYTDDQMNSLRDLVESKSIINAEIIDGYTGKLLSEVGRMEKRFDSLVELLDEKEGRAKIWLEAGMKESISLLEPFFGKLSEELDTLTGQVDSSSAFLLNVKDQMLKHYEQSFSALTATFESQHSTLNKSINSLSNHVSAEVLALSDCMDTSEERKAIFINGLKSNLDISSKVLQEFAVSKTDPLGGSALKVIGMEQSFLSEKLETVLAKLTQLEGLAGLDEKGSRLRTVFYRQARVDRKLDELLVREERSAYDLMLLLKRLQPFELIDPVVVDTDFPVALNSDDHRFPYGTARDNTRSDRFLAICETMYPKSLSFLDLGCSGGGLVLDFALAGHDAIGIEGSDFSQKTNRAAWRILDHSLFTADISKPFNIKTENEGAKEFKIITAWEVLEHIEIDGLTQLLMNVKAHLASDGLFVGSINIQPDFDEKTGAVYHKTVRSKIWWEDFFMTNGFHFTIDHKFTPYDFPRGVRGGLYDSYNYMENPESGFHFVTNYML